MPLGSRRNEQQEGVKIVQPHVEQLTRAIQSHDHKAQGIGNVRRLVVDVKLVSQAEVNQARVEDVEGNQSYEF